MVLAEQIKEIEQRREALERCLDIDQKRIDLRNEEEKTQEPNFWDNPDKAREQLRKVAGIKAWVEDYDAIRKDAEDLQLMPDFVKEGVVSEEEMDAHYAATLEKIEKLEMRNMLRRDEDKLGAILDINAGAGGTEALDWASMLMRMYTRWGEAHGYKVKVLDFQAGDEVGVKSCTMEFEGEYAYGYLKSESGVHPAVHHFPESAYLLVARFPFAKHFACFGHQGRSGFGLLFRHAFRFEGGSLFFQFVAEKNVEVADQVVAFLAGRFGSHAVAPFLPGEHGLADMDTAVVYDVRLYHFIAVRFHDLGQAVAQQVVAHVTEVERFVGVGRRIFDHDQRGLFRYRNDPV